MMRLLLIGISLLLPLMAQAQDIQVESASYGEGREAWLIRSDNAPIVTARMAFRGAGSTSDQPGREGRAQMLAALLSEGAGELDALAFNEALESQAIRLSFSVNDDALHVNLETLSENADKAFELLGLALTQPRFDEDAVNRVKAQMLTSLKRMEEQPRYLASRELSKAVFGKHPYANPTEGTVSGIAATGRTQLQQQLSRYVTVENVQISVVGDISPEWLSALLEKHLSGLPATYRPTHQVADWAWEAEGGIRLVPRNIPQTVVVFAGPGIERDDADFYTAYVLNHLLGGGTLTSKLGDEIRERRGLAYYAYTGLQVFDHGALFTGGFGTRNDQAAEALNVARNTLDAVARGDITDAEIDEAKSYIVGAWPLSLASNDGLANMLQVMQRFNLGKEYVRDRNGFIEAVTRADILRVAKRFVQQDKLVVVGVGAPDPALDAGKAAQSPNQEP